MVYIITIILFILPIVMFKKKTQLELANYEIFKINEKKYAVILAFLIIVLLVGSIVILMKYDVVFIVPIALFLSFLISYLIELRDFTKG